jgi:hypothetical protein
MFAHGRLRAAREGAAPVNRWKTTWVAAVIGLFMALSPIVGFAVPSRPETILRVGVF